MSANSVSAGTGGTTRAWHTDASSGRIHERGVGVPEPIAERVVAPAIVGLHDLPARVEVRDVGQRFVAETALREGAAPGALVQPAVEPLAERDLLGVGKRLMVEDE